jgi:hypothetical protein
VVGRDSSSAANGDFRDRARDACQGAYAKSQRAEETPPKYSTKNAPLLAYRLSDNEIETSLRKASVSQNQDTLDGSPGGASAAAGSARHNSGVSFAPTTDQEILPDVQNETLTKSTNAQFFSRAQSQFVNQHRQNLSIAGCGTSVGSYVPLLVPGDSHNHNHNNNISDISQFDGLAFSPDQTTECNAFDNLFSSPEEMMLGTLDNDPPPIQPSLATASDHHDVPVSPMFDYRSIMELDDLTDCQPHGNFGNLTNAISSAAEVHSLPSCAVQTSLLTPGPSDYMKTPLTLLPTHGSSCESVFSELSMTTASSNLFDKMNSSTAASSSSFPAVSTRVVTSEKSDDDPTSRLEKVLDAIDDAGFDSVESMIALYYASAFPAGSSLSAAQSLSKKRRLQRLLSTLHEVSKGWDQHEVQGYREGIMKSAEDIILGEMRFLTVKDLEGGNKDCVIQQLESILSVTGSRQALKENKRVFREQVRCYDKLVHSQIADK